MFTSDLRRALASIYCAGLFFGISSCGSAADETDGEITYHKSAPMDVSSQGRSLPPSSPIQRCINLGNGLDAPREGVWGYDIEDDHLREIGRAGFDTLRLPIRWDTRTMKDPPYTIDPVFFERVDHLVSVAQESGLAVILDMHHFSPMMDTPEEQTPRFLAMWKQIAEHYQDYPESIYFEVLNEPVRKLTNAKLKTIYPKVMDIIRQTNPDRWVILSGDGWGSLDGLLGVELPDDDRTIWSYHSYVPFSFTYQGAPFEDDPPPIGKRWGTEEDYMHILERTRRAAAHGATNERPIFLGEFGAYDADGRAPYADRIAWLTHMRRTNESHNIGWCAWDFGAEFAFYDVESKAWDQTMLNALMSK